MKKRPVGRPKGTTKTGGRIKGTPNKVTQSLREWITGILESNKMQFEADIKKLDAKDRLQVLTKLLEYTTPKMQSIQAEIDLNQLTGEQLDTIIHELSKSIKT